MAGSGERSASTLRVLACGGGQGRRFLFSQRFSVEKLANEFNLRWFWQAFMQYRRLVGEVLLASFLFNCWH